MARRKQNKKKQKSNIDLQVVELIVVSILLAILIYAKTGYIGENLSPFLGGLLGWIKYIIPVGTMLLAIYIACNEEKGYVNKKLILYLVLILFCYH